MKLLFWGKFDIREAVKKQKLLSFNRLNEIFRNKNSPDFRTHLNCFVRKIPKQFFFITHYMKIRIFTIRKVIFLQVCAIPSVLPSIHDMSHDQGVCIHGGSASGGVPSMRGSASGGGGGQTPNQILWDTVNKWAVHILLECILVFIASKGRCDCYILQSIPFVIGAEWMYCKNVVKF